MRPKGQSSAINPAKALVKRSGLPLSPRRGGGKSTKPKQTFQSGNLKVLNTKGREQRRQRGWGLTRAEGGAFY